MSKNEQKNVFKELRNKGILEDNKVECLKDNSVFLPVKKMYRGPFAMFKLWLFFQ